MQLSQNAYAKICELTSRCDLIIFIEKCFVLQDRVQEETGYMQEKVLKCDVSF